MRRSPWLLAAALPVLVAAAPVEIELAVHVAAGDDGAPVADAAWIDVQVERAGEQLAGADVAVTWRDAGGDGVVPHVDTVADRDALAAAASDAGAVHVFVVARLADKDVAGAWLNGVHWRYGGARRALRGRRYVILSRETRWDYTLAHELGHFFGLAHTDVDGGLMTTGRRRGDATPTLTDTQLARVSRRARAWARKARRASLRVRTPAMLEA